MQWTKWWHGRNRYRARIPVDLHNWNFIADVRRMDTRVIDSFAFMEIQISFSAIRYCFINYLKRKVFANRRRDWMEIISNWRRKLKWMRSIEMWPISRFYSTKPNNKNRKGSFRSSFGCIIALPLVYSTPFLCLPNHLKFARNEWRRRIHQSKPFPFDRLYRATRTVLKFIVDYPMQITQNATLCFIFSK